MEKKNFAAHDALTVTSLPDYVDQQRDVLVANTVMGANTLDYIQTQTGVKTTAAINLLSTEVEFGDGSVCGWNPTGKSELTQRNIVTGQIAVNMSYCWRKLLAKWTQYMVAVGAGKESLPFEEKFIEGVRKAIADALDKAIWQGDTESMDKTLKWFDGLIKIINAAPGVNKVPNIATSKTKMEAVETVLAAMPEEALTNGRIFVSIPYIRAYEQELVKANLYHFEPGKDYNEIEIPGSTVKLTAVKGLGGLKDPILVGASGDNIFYGCDMTEDKERFEFWYEKKDDAFLLRVNFNAGVQIAFPNQVVIAKVADA